MIFPVHGNANSTLAAFPGIGGGLHVVYKETPASAQPLASRPPPSTHIHTYSRLAMGAGGTFLVVLAAGTLAAALAYVRATPGDACNVAEVTVREKHAVIGSSDAEASSTLYVHAASLYKVVLFIITTARGEAKMWVPYFGVCFDKSDGWYKTYAFCEIQKENSLVKCDFMVRSCKFSCIQDIAPGGDVAFTLYANGPSRWRRTEPPAGCAVHKPLYNPTTIFDHCFTLSQATARPWSTSWPPVTPPCRPPSNCTDGVEVVLKANATLTMTYRDSIDRFRISDEARALGHGHK